VFNKVLINEARGFQGHPDRQRILNCIGQAYFDTLVTAYTADFAARPEAANRYPWGHYVQYLADTVQQRLLHPSDTPAEADKGCGESGISFTHR
jgi:hypothetical protein